MGNKKTSSRRKSLRKPHLARRKSTTEVSSASLESEPSEINCEASESGAIEPLDDSGIVRSPLENTIPSASTPLKSQPQTRFSVTETPSPPVKLRRASEAKTYSQHFPTQREPIVSQQPVSTFFFYLLIVFF